MRWNYTCIMIKHMRVKYHAILTFKTAEELGSGDIWLNFISILDTCTFYGNQYWYHHTIKALNNTADQAAQGALNKFEN